MTPWTVAHQATLSMGFSRQEYWNGLPFPSPEDLPDPGIEPLSPVALALEANSSNSSEPLGKPNLYLDLLKSSKLLSLESRLCTDFLKKYLR